MVVGGPLSPILKDVPGLATDAGLPRLMIRIFRGFWRTSIIMETAPALPIPDGKRVVLYIDQHRKAAIETVTI